MPTFSLEGIIGCGKSTTLKILGERGYTIIQEPVEAYTSFENGKYNPLECAYASPKTDSPLAQMHIMRCAHSHYPSGSRTTPPNFVFSERSFFSSEIFINAYHDLGNLSAFSRSFLLTDHRCMSTCKKKPDAYVFLDLDPKTCYSRVAQRAVSCEKPLTLELQSALREAHVAFFSKERQSVPVIEIDVSSSDTPEEVTNKVLRELLKSFG